MGFRSKLGANIYNQKYHDFMNAGRTAVNATSNALATANEYTQKGVDAQLEAAKQAKKEAGKYYGEAQGYLEPWQQAGANALSNVQGLMAGTTDITTDPSYQWRREQGVEALDLSAAAGGKLLSGQQLKAITEFGQGLASTEYQNIYNRYMGVAQMGLQAGGQMGQQAMQMSSDMQQNALYGGAAQAAGYSAMGQNTLFANALQGSGFGGSTFSMSATPANRGQVQEAGTQPGWSLQGGTIASDTMYKQLQQKMASAYDLF
jgi:hypothetical protein